MFLDMFYMFMVFSEVGEGSYLSRQKGDEQVYRDQEYTLELFQHP
jgi:hypothetical protein